MGKDKSFWIAGIVGLLLLLFVLFRRKKVGGEFDTFFSDAEVVNNLEEHIEPSAVPASLMPSQVDSGNGDTECEQSGYMSFTFPNPTPFPITLDIVNPQNYYQTLSNYTASQLNSNVNYNLGTVSIRASLYANGLLYGIDRSATSTIAVFNPSTNSLVTSIPISPNTLSIVGGDGVNSVIYNNLLIVPGFRYVTIIDVNPLSGTYNQIIATIDCGAGNILNTISIFGTTAYITTSGTINGLKKIDLTSFSVIGAFGIAASGINSCFPNYAFSQSTSRYIYLFETSTTFIVFDTFTDTTLASGLMSVASGGQPVLVGVNLYVPQNANIDIFSTVSNSVTGSIPILGKSILQVIFNGANTLYATSNASSIEAVNVNTNTLITSISTSAYISTGNNSMIINAGVLYVGGSNAAGTIITIDTNESDPAYNTITGSINTTLNQPLGRPILASSGVTANVYFTAINSHFISNTLIVVPSTPLTSQVQINLNNMANMQQNPGEICGIFYRSLTVAQMSNVFQVNWTDVNGAQDNYKLIPITYKDTMSMLNQIYVSKFFRPIVVDNTLNFYHVINPGENVYIKIYVRTYVSNITLLETGEIKPSETGTGEGAIYNPDKEYADELQQEEEDKEADWMDVEEVEAGTWGNVHINCPEEEGVEEEDNE